MEKVMKQVLEIEVPDGKKLFERMLLMTNKLKNKRKKIVLNLYL